MPDKLLLHSNTDVRVKQVLNKPPHALLVYGPAGSGKSTLASYLAASLMGLPIEKIVEHQYFHKIEKLAGKHEISIDLVREIIRKLNLKVPGSITIANRVVVIDEAHLMSEEAQNALLKVIEEPPKGTVFILTTVSDSAVLPTIASRSGKLAVLPVSQAEAKKYYSKDFSAQTIDSAWQLSGGAPGLLNAILEEDDNHPLKQSVEQAKKLITQTKYERIIFLDNLSTDKIRLQAVLDALSRILSALQRSAMKTNTVRSKRLLNARKQVVLAAKSLETNASPRLVALNLAERLTI